MNQKTSAVWFVTALGVIFLLIHFVFGWFAFVDTAQSHHETATWSAYLVEWVRDVFENMQSEMFQLAVQFLLLAGLLKKFGIIAFEQDVEDIKEKLDHNDIVVDNIVVNDDANVGDILAKLSTEIAEIKKTVDGYCE